MLLETARGKHFESLMKIMWNISLRHSAQQICQDKLQEMFPAPDRDTVSHKITRFRYFFCWPDASEFGFASFVARRWTSNGKRQIVLFDGAHFALHSISNERCTSPSNLRNSVVNDGKNDETQKPCLQHSAERPVRDAKTRRQAGNSAREVEYFKGQEKHSGWNATHQAQIKALAEETVSLRRTLADLYPELVRVQGA